MDIGYRGKKGWISDNTERTFVRNTLVWNLNKFPLRIFVCSPCLAKWMT